MKKWKKGWSIILTLALVFGTLGMAFSASAGEEPFQYPEGVTKEKTASAIEGLDNAILNLINPEKGIYTNYTVGLIAKTLIDLLNPILEPVLGGGLIPYLYWDFISDMPDNPFEAYMDKMTWDGIDVTTLNYGFTDGDEDGFFTALQYLLRPLKYMLGAFSDENTYGSDLMEMPGMPFPMPVYRYAFYPILSELGLSPVPLDEYKENYAFVKAMASACGSEDAYYDYQDQKFEIDAAMVGAKQSGNMDLFAEKKAELGTFIEKYNSVYDVMGDPMIDPILGLVKQLLSAPLPTLLDLLPKLDTMISGGAIDWVFALIAPDATKQPASLVDVLNLVLGTLPLIEDGTTAPDGTPNKKPLGITLPAFDFASLAELEQEKAFITVLRYLIDAVKQEQNIAALTKLVQGTDLESIMGLLPSLETDAAVSLVISMFNPEPEEPSTDNDPTQEPQPTQPGDDATKPTEPATQPVGTDTPDTGDHAVPVFSAATLAAAAAFVLLRKKQR